ncbi:hypothetical protein DFH07DRAFT_774636 [Mycena maculata]|uniref:Uncharacterized protein n=1 Tax=Mycena maculata TaxID=230809 RepID=A0AAD7N9V9_9AGAR|nr:hypothetical protein DFH07DRAFT_774636 [Mycena maculata]
MEEGNNTCTRLNRMCRVEQKFIHIEAIRSRMMTSTVQPVSNLSSPLGAKGHIIGHKRRDVTVDSTGEISVGCNFHNKNDDDKTVVPKGDQTTEFTDCPPQIDQEKRNSESTYGWAHWGQLQADEKEKQ